MSSWRMTRIYWIPARSSGSPRLALGCTGLESMQTATQFFSRFRTVRSISKSLTWLPGGMDIGLPDQEAWALWFAN